MRSCSASDPVRIAQEERIGIPILGSRGYRIWFRFGTGPIPVNIYGTTDGGGRLTDSLDKHGFWRDALGCDTRGCACVCVETRKYTFTALYTGAGGSLVAMRTLARSCFVYKNACILRAKPAPAAALR